MAVSRYYSSYAVVTALTGPISNSATTIGVGSVTGFPVQYPYTLSIDSDNVNKELVEVTNAVGTTLTVIRGRDGTTAVAHTLGAQVSHDHSARDFRESREHEAGTTAVHGVAGAVVGTTDTQALTNKDLTSGTNTFPSSLATDAEVSAAVAAEVTARNSAISTAVSPKADAATVNAAIALKQDAATAATLTGTQTLTNKTVTDGTYVRSSKSAKIPFAVSAPANFPASPSIGDLCTITTTDGQLWIYRSAIDGWDYIPSDAIVATRVASGIATNPAWTALAPLFSSGWSTPTNWAYKDHGRGLVTVRGRFVRSGATITAASDGNVPNSTVTDLSGLGFALPADNVPVTLLSTAGSAWFGYLTTAGLLILSAGTPTATLVASDQLSVYVTYAV